jgi:hypothetical protein
MTSLNSNNNNDNDFIVCRFNNSLTITYSKNESNIINGKSENCVIGTFQNLIESHFKNRPNDVIHLNHNGSFNRIENQYVQMLEKIKAAIKEGKDGILFTCDVQHEILCNLCKKEWFLPSYSHINICDDCDDCFFN